MGVYKTYRATQRKNSNNSANPNKNVCALAVAKHFGCENETRTLHNLNDNKRALSARWKLRSVRSYAKATVGASRKALANLDGDHVGFFVWVDGHVMALHRDGSTAVDTDPRKNDRRKVRGVWAVCPKR